MRLFVVQAPDAHGAPGPVRNYIGQVIPLQITDELAAPARLEAVQPAEDGQVLLTFDLLGADLLWNVLTNERNRPYQPHAGT